jgi:hypothetical protein
MDFARLRNTVWVGFCLGIVTMFGITITLIPVSYVMNKFIYHGVFMRTILGLITGALSIFAFLIISILLLTGSLSRVHYFGLIPMIKVGDPVEPTGYFAFFMKILTVVIHPLCMFYGGGDIEGYKETISQCLVSDESPTLDTTLNGNPITVTKGAVCEEFFEAARKAGAEKDNTIWHSKLDALRASGISAFIFS